MIEDHKISLDVMFDRASQSIHFDNIRDIKKVERIQFQNF